MIFQIRVAVRRGRVQQARNLWSRRTKAGKFPESNFVGPPDPMSNIRPLKLRRPTSDAERELQRLQLEMWAFNHHFWKQHNTEFQERKEEFIRQTLEEKRARGEIAEDVKTLTANELSVFYKQFLDENFQDHMNYSKTWMRLNFMHTWRSLRSWFAKKHS